MPEPPEQKSGPDRVKNAVHGVDEESLLAASDRLVRFAVDADRSGQPARESGHSPAALSEFVQTYREWIILERSELGTQQEQIEQWQMLVHCMVTGETIAEALGHLIQFSRVVWGTRAITGLRSEGENAILVFNEPHHDGPSGLIAANWILSLTLSTLEFLAGVKFQGVSGRVKHAACLPQPVARLLFDARIEYERNEIALVIPRALLRRKVMARHADLADFFSRLMPLTLGVVRSDISIAGMVTGLIRDQRQGPQLQETSRQSVCSTLGMSEATLRRRLGAEGTTFRAIRDSVFNDLATDWIESGEFTVGAIAERLGFSDAFAFRRFFRRMNGCSPSDFRKRRT